MSFEKNPTARFSDRVENYIKYRPGYPDSLIDCFVNSLGLNDGTTVADFGSGTGILSKLLLEKGAEVFGIEPNTPMRQAAEKILKGFPNFHSLEGRSEASGLPDQSMDLITAAQAFHWFDPLSTRAEFERILKPDGFVALIWNSRNTTASPVLGAYQKLIDDFAVDYQEIHHKKLTPEDFGEFFGPQGYQKTSFQYSQTFDLEGFKGRLLSCSYMPGSSHSVYPAMLKAIESNFKSHSTQGKVDFPYQTELYFGKLS